jgi:hypothetical protein
MTTTALPYSSGSAARCIKENLDWFACYHDDEARHGLFMLAQLQLDSLIQRLSHPGDPGPGRNDPEPNPREAAQHIAVNLRSVAVALSQARTSGAFRLALEQLEVLIECLPKRPPEQDPYVDPSREPRECDHCGTVYRGPAVYCSRVCAYADA